MTKYKKCCGHTGHTGKYKIAVYCKFELSPEF